MTLIPIKTPLLAKKMFPNYVWDIPSNEKVIYLTFDDGPTPEITDWVLKTLDTFNAKATFFCIGDNVSKYPDIHKNILEHGHVVGNHTFNHLKGWKTKTKKYLENVQEAQKILDIQNPKSSKTLQNLFRPPYGKMTTKQSRKLIALGYKIIMWDVLSFDWQKETSEAICLENVLSKTDKGSIVVFHDSKKAAKNMQYVLPKVLRHFSDKGYVFEALNFKYTAG